jgi:hypothetical protein
MLTTASVYFGNAPAENMGSQKCEDAMISFAIFGPEAIHSCFRLSATVMHEIDKSAGQFLNPVGLAKPQSLAWD